MKRSRVASSARLFDSSLTISKDLWVQQLERVDEEGDEHCEREEEALIRYHDRRNRSEEARREEDRREP